MAGPGGGVRHVMAGPDDQVKQTWQAEEEDGKLYMACPGARG